MSSQQLIKHPLNVEGIPFEMVEIPAGTFMMGDEHGDLDKDWTFQPHPVQVPSFWMATTPVTQALWERLMGERDFRFNSPDRQVERVSWLDIVTGVEGKPSFLEVLNDTAEAKRLHEKDGKHFRLPSEAMWEYAARGGTEGAKAAYKYAGSNNLEEVGWYYSNSHGESKPVGMKLPNQLGLYDMSGNIYEWCQDRWHKNNGAPADGSAWEEGDERRRVVRGGSWVDFDADVCRCASRSWSYVDYRYNYIGFRLSRY